MTDFHLPHPSKQVAFHQLLVAARATVLHDALVEALANADPEIVSLELNALAPRDGRMILAGAGVRDELVFATPEVLRQRPTVLGHYRLLTGVSKKAFYTAETGFGRLRSMEEQDKLAPSRLSELPDVCAALNGCLAELIAQLSPEVTPRDIEQLPLLTLGAEFDGGWRNGLGTTATTEVFLAIREVVEPHLTAETATTLTIVNASGRSVTIRLTSDPDVAISEQFPDGTPQLNVAVEIKGGTDRSNAHNRAGEAEKSHQKVRTTARDFWTIIAMKGVDRNQLSTESPTTRRWYDIAEVLGRTGTSWREFENDLRGAIGI